VNRLREYHIQFVGLEPGNHLFEFEVNETFFEHFEFSQIQHGNVHVTVNLNKLERMMSFNISIDGEVLVTCDRCTNEFTMPVSDSQQLIVKLGTEFMEESEDVVIIPETEYKFDLSTYIYEFIHLSLPARIIHPDDENGNSTCDPEMLRLLENLAPTHTIDPRWEMLNKLKNEN
jgi:uncharacterized metal-binding protein YceD (DUF177 family)